MTPSELPELYDLERLIDAGAEHLDARVVGEVAVGERRFALHAIALGNPSLDVPAVGFFGGVHGLERIGAQVVIAYLHSLVMRLAWDDVLHRQLESLRLIFMPLINPGGVWLGTRANPNGVDLMRNAPLESTERVPWLIGGQRISASLPWYRGAPGGPMEAESQALCRVVEEELLAREFCIALDCHSGFGINDRIWFPYAHTVRPIGELPEIHALKEIFDQTNSHHRYIFEPQSRQYLAHGDLWDHLCRRADAKAQCCFLPLTLEMGSWLWVKKNPRQIFSRHGIFNPLIDHRQQRVLRRHMAWFDFLTRAASSHRHWLPTGAARESHRQRAGKVVRNGAAVSRWVLLRGLTREARHWGGFAAQLGEEVPEATVFAPDLPGNGTLCAQKTPLRVEAMVEALRAQLLAQSIAPPYHLLAMSLGAMVAAAWAQRHPDEIAGAVLINTSLRPFSPFYRRLKPGNYPLLLRLALARGSDRDWESAILELTSRRAGGDELLTSWLAYRREYPVTMANALRQLIAALRYRAPLVMPPVPLLILSSRNDALVDSRCSAQLAERWNAPHAVHPDAGHDLPLDDGAWVASQVSRWLRRLST